MKPAKQDTGIVFVRKDVTSLSNVILASYANVFETLLSTTISNDAKVKVSTIEHIMAAIWGCNIDNLIIELDGEEVPVMDGSSQPFVFLLECAGIKVLPALKKSLKILKEISVCHKDSEIVITKSSEFKVNMVIDFSSKAIGKQSMAFTDHRSFKSELASARTFGFLHELESLKSLGLAQGASLDNAVGIDKDTILNSEGLRFDDEFVRHKTLDAVGDFFTSGGSIIGQIDCYKPGHYLNNELLRKVFENPASYEWIAS